LTDQHPDHEPLPPSTVPASWQLHLLGLPDDLCKGLHRALVSLVVDCGRIMDLSLLSGVTIGSDYEHALASVDLGYESSVAKGYTKTKDLVGVAKVLRVKRDGAVKAHLVFNANTLTGLVSESEEEWLFAANIVAHELGHVSAMAWLEESCPGTMLSEPEGDGLFFSFQYAAHAIWEEYAACRLSALISDTENVKQRYAGVVQRDFSDALERARSSIKSYRRHGNVDQLVLELLGVLGNALKWTAYLAGHLDGCECDEAITDLAPSIGASGFEGAVSRLIAALRSAWDTKLQWENLDDLNGIIEALSDAFETTGAHLTLNRSGPSHVAVPFTAETMPNGEADMMLIALQKALGQRS
jgi:hypothetical protein